MAVIAVIQNALNCLSWQKEEEMWII